MRNTRGFLIVLAVVCMLLPAQESFAAVSMADLQRQAQQMRDREAKLWRDREVQQNAELQKQLAAAEQAVQRRARADARSKALDTEWNANDQRIQDMQALLHQYQGNLGELFGVTRQVAGDSASVLHQSLQSLQFATSEGEESREDLMRRIAAAKTLPSFDDLSRMWYELQREMTESGKVVRFKGPVLKPDAEQPTEEEIVRVGPYIAVSGGKYLAYDPLRGYLKELSPQLGGARAAIAARLEKATGGYVKAVVDPARGPLLELVSERPDLIQRIQNGEVIGYLIIFVGVLGALLALFQYVYLVITRMSVVAQLRNLAKPTPNNPLGRVLLAFQGEGKAANPEVAELVMSEAVLREMPRLLRFQAFVRLCIAAGPLLGLVGTVVGMIITFHAITATGSSDPKLMAQGIGQAMIATVLGLGIAIPLLFINFGLTALSNGVTQVLDEQAQAVLADELKKHQS